MNVKGNNYLIFDNPTSCPSFIGETINHNSPWELGELNSRGIEGLGMGLGEWSLDQVLHDAGVAVGGFGVGTVGLLALAFILVYTSAPAKEKRSRRKSDLFAAREEYKEKVKKIRKDTSIIPTWS